MTPSARRRPSFRPVASAPETRMVHIVFPHDTNSYGTLFGGKALAWMDLACAIAATRWCRKGVVTASSERVDFKVPVRAGSLVELAARVAGVGRSSIKVNVELSVEEVFSGRRSLCARGVFTMVAVDRNGNPIPALGRPTGLGKRKRLTSDVR